MVLCLLINDWVVVLKVGAKAFSLETGPEDILVHRGAMLRPGRHVVCVDRKLCHKIVDRSRVFKEEDLDIRKP